MSADAVTAGLTQIFREAFDDDAIVLHRDTAAKDIEGWDSMAHVRLIIAIERHFRVQLPSTKVAGLKNVGDMIELINSCLARQHP